MLETMFGINASGKDTIAKELKIKYPDIFVTSESRLLMYHLGIIGDFTATSVVSEANYLALENTPQEKILRITNGVYRASLEEFSASDKITILLSHLVFLLHIDKKPVFLDQKDPPFPELSTGLIHVKVDPQEALARMAKDNADGTRTRHAAELEIIQKHQVLCDQKWAKITARRDPRTFVNVINQDLDDAVHQVENFIFGKNPV